MSRCCILLASLTVLAGLGCGPGNRVPSGPPDAAQAKQGLTQALEAWRSGTKLEALQSATPRIIVADAEWASGAQLSSFEIQNEGELRGNRMRFLVLLDVRSSGNPSVKKATRYLVATSPVLTVSRNDPNE